MAVGGPLPSGTVTFAFTDIEESTRRWERNHVAMEAAVRRHDELVRGAIERHGGYVFKALGDSFCAAFSRPADAIAAMLDAQRSLAAEDFSQLDGLHVRAAIHTGTAHERDGDYFGPALNRVARLLAIAHGGQIILSGATSAIVEEYLPSGVTLHDLGEHRLKDLAKAERVYQVRALDLPAEFPPLRSLSAQKTNLPLELTSFVGRETEIAEIASLIHDHRLVTVVGSGGVGKTRTALHVAANLREDPPDGIWLIELAPLSSGDYIVPTVAHALGIKIGAGDPLHNLMHALKSKHALLIFDNCEHLVEAVGRAVTAILSSCPNIKVLASSRQPLEIAGEQSYQLPSLAVLSENEARRLRAADAMRCAAIALFAERAAAAERRFALTDENAPAVADICRRLDGIPLAIELAASKMSLLSVRQLSEMLNARFRVLSQTRSNRLPRQQTLRALIDWSFDLLDEDERAVFRRLAIFAGGWTLQAAAAACSDDSIDAWQVLDLLSALASKSLIVVDPDEDDRRYRMLYSIREYSRERLTASSEDAAVATKHARYYAELLGELAPLVDSLEDVRWQEALAPEIDNIRAALEWTIFAGNESETGLKLLAGIEWPELLTTPQEAIRWYDAAAKMVGLTADGLTKARVFRHFARLQWLVGRPIAERENFTTEAIAIARASCDPSEIARALANIGSCYLDAGRFDEAESMFAEAYGRPESLSKSAANEVLRRWAITSLQRGDDEAARRRFTEVAHRERPGSEAHASALLNLGELEFAAGNVEHARAAARVARRSRAFAPHRSRW